MPTSGDTCKQRFNIVGIYFLSMLSANAQQLTKSTPPNGELETVATFDGPHANRRNGFANGPHFCLLSTLG